MGAKITIDSATLMNKGLEVIEAHYLFGLPYDRIEVVVHPQSIVHGMARLCDGALIAHVGHPDMRVPIAYALTYPVRRADRRAAPRPHSRLRLTFEPPDTDTFRCLALARGRGRDRRHRAVRPRTPRTRRRWPRSWPAGSRSSTSPRWWPTRSMPCPSTEVDGLDAVRHADAAARAAVADRLGAAA